MAPRKVLLDGIALRNPITGIAACCARAASGHAAAPAPLSSVAKNFRRSMWLAMVTLRLGVIHAMEGLYHAFIARCIRSPASQRWGEGTGALPAGTRRTCRNDRSRRGVRALDLHQ